MALDFSVMQPYAGLLWKALVMTVWVSFWANILSILIGTGVALLRISPLRALRWLGTIWIEVIRNTPLLLQLFLIYFASPQFGIHFTGFQAAVLGLGINTSAYVAETVRAGIQAIPKGQIEAAKAVGMTSRMTMLHIILPQAIRITVPPLANTLILLIKNSSLVSLVTLTELMRAADVIIANTFKPFESYLLIGALYFVINFALSRLTSYLERRMQAA